MSHLLKVELSEAAYTALQFLAREGTQSPAELAAAALERHFGTPDGTRGIGNPTAEAAKEAAHTRFESHFGAVNLGRPTGVDNEGIDADLARASEHGHAEG